MEEETRYFVYMRISTKEERHLQKYSRQEKSIEAYAKTQGIELDSHNVYQDDASGKSFDRPDWKRLERAADRPGDTIIFKDITRFTREAENGYKKYMQLMERGISLIFLDNPTVSTDYIKNLIGIAKQQKETITSESLKFVAKIILLTELDRAEKERTTLSKRIKDGIAASPKVQGRKKGQVDKLTPELKDAIREYKHDRSIKAVDVMDKFHISRNTFKKYCNITD